MVAFLFLPDEAFFLWKYFFCPIFYQTNPWHKSHKREVKVGYKFLRAAVFEFNNYNNGNSDTETDTGDTTGTTDTCPFYLSDTILLTFYPLP